MHSGVIFGITVVLIMLLQGCGHKATLKLPPPKTPAPQVQVPPAPPTGTQNSDPQKSATPSPQQGKEP